MKKFLALTLAAVMLCTAVAALAEEEHLAPLYATVGEALEASEERIAGGEGDYYAVVTETDGKYYRSVAAYDEQMTALQEAISAVDLESEGGFEKLDEAFAAADEYLASLPILYSEEFTAERLTEEEMAELVGKTIGELNGLGYETESSGTEGDDIVFSLRIGIYAYACKVDADADTYFAAQDAGTEGDLVVKEAAFGGISYFAYEQRFHTDGTVEEPADPLAEYFAAFNEIIASVQEMITKVQNGEEVNVEEFAAGLKEQYPDYADTIDMYMEIYNQLGAEQLMALLTPAE